MNEFSEETLERTLSIIEVPGEDARELRTYLDETLFAERVMEKVRLEASRSQKTMAWALFALINLVFLIVFGSNRYIAGSYFAMQETLSQFFFLFLGISFLGALFGLIMSADTSWIETLPHSLQPFLKDRRRTVRNGMHK